MKSEAIWHDIIALLIGRGYCPDLARFGTLADFTLAVAYFHNLIMEKSCLYRGAGSVLLDLYRRGVRQGIISNAQFYTPVTVDLLLRQKLGDQYPGFDKLFDPRLVFFSYQLGRAKPDSFIYEKAIKALKKLGIAPHEAVYVGNDMYKDIWGAQRLGFKTIFAAQDQQACRTRIDKRQCHKLIPDAIIRNLTHISKVVATPTEKAPLPSLSIGFVHYHIKPGGIKTVLTNNARALALRRRFENVFIQVMACIEKDLLKVGIFEIKDDANRPISNLHIRNIDISEMAYSDVIYSSKEEFTEAARRIKRIIVRNLDLSRCTPENPYIIHAHNLPLAKNPCVAMAMVLVARWALQHKKPLLILNQIHDFAENIRFDLLRHVLNCTGSYDPEFAAFCLYPQLPNIFYVVLTREDRDNLTSIGLDPEHIFLLPDSIGSDNIEVISDKKSASRSEYLNQLRAVIAEAALSAGFYFEADRRIILQPIKAMRRKNIAESILLIAALNHIHPCHQLMVTLDATSPADVRYSGTIKQFVKQNRLPAYIGIDHRSIISALDRRFRPSESNLLELADILDISSVILSTSFIEGFGLPFIEGWLFRKCVVGRRIENVIRDFEENGIDFDHLYPRLAVSTEWLDIDLDLLIDRYRRRIDDHRRRLDFPAIGRTKMKNEILNEKIFNIGDEPFVDFVDLDLKSQLYLIKKLQSQPRLMRRFIETNPVIEQIAAMIQNPPTSLIDKNRSVIIRRYGLRAQADKLIKIFDSARGLYQPSQNRPFKKAPINNRPLIEKFLSVKNTKLLI